MHLSKSSNMACLILMHLSRAVAFALSVAAVTVVMLVPASHHLTASDKANMLMAYALVMQAVGVPWSLCLMHSDLARPPGNVSLLLLAAAEWVMGCLTYGTACAGLAVAHTAVTRGACVPPACARYLSVAVMACVAGLLGSFSAIGTLWTLAPRFRH